VNDTHPALNAKDPPNGLFGRLFGHFQLWRGAVPIQDAVWPRPAVRKLCAYFVMHAGESLIRDRIIDDLWPGSDPDAARGSLKTVLSLMRKIIDRDMPTPEGYLEVSGETYMLCGADSDVAVFERLIRVALTTYTGLDAPPVSDELLTALERYGPLLPEYAREPWVIETGERLRDEYLRGCIYVAEARLDIGQTTDAERWATRAVETAVWSEDAYQIIMRAQARRGETELALHTAQACQKALERELRVQLSPLTLWLIERLRAGEAI